MVVPRLGCTGYQTIDVAGGRKRHVAGYVEAPEAGIDQEQPDTYQPGIVGRNVPRRAVGGELAEPGAENHQDAEGGAAGDGVDDTRRIGVVIAEQLDHPAAVAPAPGGVDRPGDRADEDGEEPEREGANPLDHRARDDRRRGPGEQQEGRPEDAGDAASKPICAQVRTHFLAPGIGRHGKIEVPTRIADASGDAGTAGEGPVNPPAEEEPGDGDQRDQHRVLHQRVHVVSAPARTYFVHAEADVDQEHQRDRDPIVKLSKYDC